MKVLELVLFIIEQSLIVLREQWSGERTKTPEALVRIVRAGYQAYQAEVGQPLDVEKIKPYEPI